MTNNKKPKKLEDYKLGEEIDKDILGELNKIFSGKVRLLKITYTIQDEEGTTIDLSSTHDDYEEDEQNE